MSLLWPGLFDFFASGLPRFWTSFDVIANLLVYVLGAMLLSWALQAKWPSLISSVMAFVLSAALSFGVEWLQVLLPTRVPSLLDWILNCLGAALGASVALLSPRIALESWLRDRFAVFRSAGALSAQRPGLLLALLCLWFAAQLSPQGLAFSVGEWVGQRFVFEASQIGTIYAPLLEAVATALMVLVIGLFLQVLLGTGINPVAPTLVLFAVLICLKAAVFARLWGPSSAFGWLSAVTQGGLLIGLFLLSVLCLMLRFSSAKRWWLVLGLLALLTMLFNLAPESEYRRNLMQTWNPKQWRAVEALLVWIGFAWPALAALYCVLQIRQSYDDRRG